MAKVKIQRAPLILSASLPGAPVREVNSKGVVGQSTVPTGPRVGTDHSSISWNLLSESGGGPPP